MTTIKEKVLEKFNSQAEGVYYPCQIEKAIDLTLSEVGGMVGMEIERFDSKAGCDIIVAVLKDLKQKLEVRNGKQEGVIEKDG